ncbi:hypothetical protein MWU59_07160 [Flavobacteriaceae bacterium F08102]|nr:hypothetical protein [Flavobacteriaceae bacterium F08102]
MNNRRLKYSITYFLLGLFLITKLTSLHVLGHADDKEHIVHCLICDQVIAHNLTPALTPDLEVYTIKPLEIIAQKEILPSYSFVISNVISTDQLFSRPPPAGV